MGHEIR